MILLTHRKRTSQIKNQINEIKNTFGGINRLGREKEINDLEDRVKETSQAEQRRAEEIMQIENSLWELCDCIRVITFAFWGHRRNR